MKKITSLLFVFLITLVGFAQGHETFDNLEDNGTSYQDGSFTGQDGSTWEYLQARGDSDAQVYEDNPAIMLGKGKDSELTSGTLQNGIGTLQFTYKKAFGGDANLEVYVNDDLVYTATTEGEDQPITTEEITVNVDGEFTLRFYNPSGAGQVNIDDIIWTATGEEATINITSPSDGHQHAPGENPVINFNVTNFDISSDAEANDGDGYVQYQINEEGFTNHFSDESIELSDLDAGEHEFVIKLVDNDGEEIEGLSDSVTFILHEYQEVSNLQELREGNHNEYYTLTGEVILTYQQNFRNQKYIQDETAAILIDDNAGIITTTYNRYDGITGITGKLNENNGILQFQPEADTEEATSSDNFITPEIITIAELMDNPGAYESQIIALEDVEFVLEEGENPTFQTGVNYTVKDQNDNSTIMRTNFYDADYIGDNIPTGIQDAMVGIAARFHDDGQFFIRDRDDLEGTPLSTDKFTKNDVSLYPNPTTNLVNIEIEGQANVEIYSFLGQKVIEKNIQEKEIIAVDHLNSGIYLVKITQNGNTVTKKLIIQ